MNRYTGRPVAPEQAISRSQALHAATVAGAMLTFEEDVKGRLAPGLLADMTVLDRDPLAVPDEALMELRSELTLVGGRIVWSSPAMVSGGPSMA
jgi:predicted amidohydrolase YtcJ